MAGEKGFQVIIFIISLVNRALMKKVFFFEQQFIAVSYGSLLIILLPHQVCVLFQAGTSLLCLCLAHGRPWLNICWMKEYKRTYRKTPSLTPTGDSIIWEVSPFCYFEPLIKSFTFHGLRLIFCLQHKLFEGRGLGYLPLWPQSALKQKFLKIRTVVEHQLLG